MTILTTPRLRLEPYAEDHLEGLLALNTDPEVMRFLGGPVAGRARMREGIARIGERWRATGYSWWAFAERDSGTVLGAGGLQHLRRDDMPEPDPACPLEIAWRLRREHWGRGLATEAARAIGDFAFDALRAAELLAVCHPDNAASAGVMRRLGMRDAGLQRWYGKPMATYAIDAADWRAGALARPTSPA